MNGIINFFKPKGMTSHTAVNFMRKKLNMKKIGHTGTLDPEVAGVLPLCVGKATRVSEYFLDADKEYIGELTLGIETDSQDGQGSVINYSNKEVTEDEIIRAFKEYQGEIMQVPPMYSAIRHKGKHLYELAREGIEVERKSRKVNIYSNEILNIQGNKILFRVKCSKGTYIRTMCDDIGKSLGTYGYMSYLIRTAVGDFKIEDSLGKDTIWNMDMEDIGDIFIPMDQAIKNFPKIILDKSYYNDLSHGKMVEVDDTYEVNTIYRMYSDDVFIGLGEVIENNETFFFKFKKVLLV